MIRSKETIFKTDIILGFPVIVTLDNGDTASCSYNHQDITPFIVSVNGTEQKFNSLDDMVNSLGNNWVITT